MAKGVDPGQDRSGRNQAPEADATPPNRRHHDPVRATEASYNEATAVLTLTVTGNCATSGTLTLSTSQTHLQLCGTTATWQVPAQITAENGATFNRVSLISRLRISRGLAPCRVKQGKAGGRSGRVFVTAFVPSHGGGEASFACRRPLSRARRQALHRL
jgi:hypothetical protein